MKITGYSCFRYSIPFKKPLIHGKHTLQAREGIVISVTDDAGYYGFGEIAPLPGLNRETLEEAEKQIIQAKERIINQILPTGVHDKLNETLAAWFVSYKFLPSVQFGFETAVLNLIANRKNILLKDIIAETDYQKVPICGLLPGPTQDILTEADEMLKRGIKAIKLKVGRNGIDEDIRLIQSLNQKLEGKAVLRLDANQRWDLNQAVLLGNEIGCAAVEYIEEPFTDPKHYDDFFMKTTIPIAIDETLSKIGFDHIKSVSAIDFLVLKPTKLGGITKTWGWMTQAQKVGINTVLSSSFETSLGLCTLINLAACNRISYPAGIDTYKWFAGDLLKEPITIDHGMVSVRPPIRSIEEINVEYLQKII